jgi:putative ATPase
VDNLFADDQAQREMTPLAERMRPRNLTEVAGQEGVVSILRELKERKQLPSLIMWGPPGCGKTTIARLIAGERYEFVPMSAVLAGVKDVRQAVEAARQRRNLDNRGTLLFLDEIHRFNKAQQDVLLPHVEAGTIVLVGATTENPSFEVVGPLLSRCRVLTLTALEPEQIAVLLERALTDTERGLGLPADAAADGVLGQIAALAAGDARFALNTLEVCAGLLAGEDAGQITTETLKRALAGRALLYDKGGDEHFNAISALHKSLRGSDPDAALYWLARMLEAGDDPKYVVRRLVRFASEDIGLADPWALMQANAARQAVEFLGMPECNTALAQLVVYLACAPKSNAMYAAYGKARQVVQEHGALPVPLHIRNAPTRLMKELGYGQDYKYAHSYEGGFVADNYFPDKLRDDPPRLLELTGRGAEKTLAERLRNWWGERYTGGEIDSAVSLGNQSNQTKGSASRESAVENSEKAKGGAGHDEKRDGTTAVPGRRHTDTLRKSQRKLPHWQLSGRAYFVTWRLKKEKEQLSPEERSLIKDALIFGADKRYKLYAYVVMDDHVHCVILPIEDNEVPDIVHTWKSYTTNQLQRKHERKGTVWDSEYYDRIIRDDAELNEKCEYVITNPQRRWPDIGEYEWCGWV